MNTNRILPPGSQFQAVVDGKPTGLAGCMQSAECPRHGSCLRADSRLPYRGDFLIGAFTPADCRAFIPSSESVQ